MTSAHDVRVVDNPAANAYEAYIGDELAGYVAYRLLGDRIVLVHTEVFRDFQDHGVAGALAAFALDAARARGLSVEPQCPYIAGYIKKHPEYSDLVA